MRRLLVRYFYFRPGLLSTSSDHVLAEYGVRGAEVIVYVADESVAELRRGQLLLLELTHEMVFVGDYESEVFSEVVIIERTT